MSPMRLAILSFASLALLSCERPSSPDFETQHSMDIPLIGSITYKFLGDGSGVIIDSTSEDYDVLFSIRADGLVSISSEIDFGIGDFDDIIPEMEVDPTDVEAEIGLIDVSFTGSGETSYEEVTGVPAETAPGPGSPISEGQSPELDIELKVDDFESGVLESGGISISFINHLGFHVSAIDAELFSGGTSVAGPEQLHDIDPGDNKTLLFSFQEDDEIEVPIYIRIQISWDTQTVQDPPGDLLVSATDENLLAKNVTAVIRQQHFYTNGLVEMDDDEFRFRHPSHYVQIKEGMLSIGDIVNEIDLDIDTLTISFPDILIDYDGTGTYDTSDSLWIRFEGHDRILRESNAHLGQPAKNRSLADARIFAYNNEITYNVHAITEDASLHPSDSVRTVAYFEEFLSSVTIDDLEIRTSFGEVQPRLELLTDDVTGNGKVDLFRDDEAEVSEVDYLDDFSDRLSGMHFANPTLELIYDTNVGVEGIIVAAIVGVNGNDEKVYLTGKPGTDRQVDPGIHNIDNLVANDIPLRADQMVAFDITPVTNIGETVRSNIVRFNTENSNVDDFLSNLPVEIRFIGKNMVNPDQKEGFLVDPVEFETNMSIDIPINLSTDPGNPATFEDTVSTDLSDLPSPEDDLQLSDVTLHIAYENGLPFRTGFELEFRDEHDQVIETVTGEPFSPVSFMIDGAQVDSESRFVMQSNSGMTEIRLDQNQMENLYRTRSIRLIGDLATSQDDISSEVKLRADDAITLRINASMQTTIRVN